MSDFPSALAQLLLDMVSVTVGGAHKDASSESLEQEVKHIAAAREEKRKVDVQRAAEEMVRLQHGGCGPSPGLLSRQSSIVIEGQDGTEFFAATKGVCEALTMALELIKDLRPDGSDERSDSSLEEESPSGSGDGDGVGAEREGVERRAGAGLQESAHRLTSLPAAGEYNRPQLHQTVFDSADRMRLLAHTVENVENDGDSSRPGPGSQPPPSQQQQSLQQHQHSSLGTQVLAHVAPVATAPVSQQATAPLSSTNPKAYSALQTVSSSGGGGGGGDGSDAAAAASAEYALDGGASGASSTAPSPRGASVAVVPAAAASAVPPST